MMGIFHNLQSMFAEFVTKKKFSGLFIHENLRKKEGNFSFLFIQENLEKERKFQMMEQLFFRLYFVIFLLLFKKAFNEASGRFCKFQAVRSLKVHQASCGRGFTRFNFKSGSPVNFYPQLKSFMSDFQVQF